MPFETISQTDSLFFGAAGLDLPRVQGIVDGALGRFDDGELYLEYNQSESFSWDDGRLKNASFDLAQGFGLRAVLGEAVGFAHATALDEAALARAAVAVSSIGAGGGGAVGVPVPTGVPLALYDSCNPLAGVSFEEKVKLLAAIDAYVRGCEARVHQVSVSLSAEWQAIQIMRVGGFRVADVRPEVHMNINVAVRQGDRIEHSSWGGGGRESYDRFLRPDVWREMADTALARALAKLDSVEAMAGEMTVVLGPGWPAVIFHEAVGHGLEGDFNRKKTSVFSGLMGQMVAAPGVTVVDDGTMVGRRGSLTVDDEGTPTQRTVLIEDGRLVGYMQDRLNARLMGVSSTGNGRRESFACAPMPRMTNTMLVAGDKAPEEIIASVKRGLYVNGMEGGQVDITSGKFVFSASDACEIVDGKLGRALKGASLVGTGFETLKKISMIGNDFALDNGIGMCGKDGQGVPVGVGQPTIRLDGITVGGREA